jgi:hypothetical protein
VAVAYIYFKPSSSGQKRVVEGSSFPITASFFDENFAPVTPASVRYRIDCVSTGTELLGWTEAPVATTLVVSAASTHNRIISTRNLLETKAITVECEFGTPNQFSDEYRWSVRNIPGIFTSIASGSGAGSGSESSEEAMTIGTLANSATPSIAGANNWVTGGTTTITNLTNGQVGKIVRIIAEHTITIQHGPNILLADDLGFTMVSGDVLTLIQKGDNKWWEVARSSESYAKTADEVAAAVLVTNSRYRPGDIRRYGAAVDGVTNDYAAIVAAIAAVGNRGSGYYFSGGTVYFPVGTTKCNSTIELKKAVTLQGEGSGLPENSGSRILFPSGVTGIVVNRYNTLNGTTEGSPTTAADGTIISNLYLEGSGGATAHGIWLRARAVIRDVKVNGFSGDGIRVLATSGSGGATEGNANNFSIHTARLTNNGGNGLYTDGADVNAGVCINIDATTNGGWGIYDSSFLGNTYIACHSSANTSGAYKTDDANARNLFLNCYTEGDQPAASIVSPTLVLGQGFPDSLGGVLSTSGAVVAGKYGIGYKETVGGYVWGNVIGGDAPNGDIFSWGRTDINGGTPWRIKWVNGTTGDFQIDFANLDGAGTLRFKGKDTAFTGGRSAAVPYAVTVGDKFFIGDNGSLTRNLTTASAKPTSGSYAQGDFLFNTAPALAGSPITLLGWHRLTTGSNHTDGTDWASCYIRTDDHAIGTLANSATPSVSKGDRWLTGGTTTITNFTSGQVGQIIHILSEHAITITDGTNIFLNGSVNFVMANTDSLTLIQKADGKWYELSRSVN